MGSVLITDPRGEPLPPDQSSFSARRRSIAIFGDIIKYPFSVFSNFHPGRMKGKVTSSFGQWLALCPVIPHEKHFTSAQLRRSCRNLGPSPGDCCPVKYVCTNASKPVGSTRVGGAGSIFTVSDINSWVSFSNGVTSGVLIGGGGGGCSS